jgi:hypothetical protein
VLLLLPSPASLFIYSSVRDFPSSPLALRVPRPLCYVSFLLLLLIIQVFFLFSLGGGRSVHGAMLIWPRVVCGNTMCHLAHLVVCVFPSHLGAGDWWPGGFLVSPFNMKWRCYVQAGGVEESKFCLFLVVFPVRCVSSISPRFYFRRHAFCFLPLAAILESSMLCVSQRRNCWGLEVRTTMFGGQVH